MSQVDVLYRLQQIDSEIRAKKKRLGEVLRAQKETDALLAARDRVATAAAARQKWQVRQQDLNLELRGLTDKTRAEEERLYSGKVKNTKELGDIQKEVEVLGRRRAALEDTLLEAMINSEESQEEERAAGDALRAIQAAWEASQQHLRQEQHSLALRLNELNGQRAQQTPLVPAASLAVYEQIARKKGGLAVAVLENGRCLGCQVTVSGQKASATQSGQLVTCGNCDRILYPR